MHSFFQLKINVALAPVLYGLAFISAFIIHDLHNPSLKGTAILAPPKVNPVDTVNKTFLALGDSYTIGENVSPVARYPTQTVALLSRSNITFKMPFYLATTGWTTVNLMNAIKTAGLKPPYDVVSLMIGVNDQYQTRDTTNYRNRLNQLLNKAIYLAGNKSSRVFVLSIPDYSVTPFVRAAYKQEISKQIGSFNQIIKELALQHKVSYIDVTESCREAASDRSLIARDSLHFSGTEYMKWASFLAPRIKAAL